jgi:hypothetical protein
MILIFSVQDELMGAQISASYSEFSFSESVTNFKNFLYWLFGGSSPGRD